MATRSLAPRLGILGHDGTVRVERVSEDGWEELRALRLRSLREDPAAFGVNTAREEGFRESHWRMRLRSSAWFLARAGDGSPMGFAAALTEPGGALDDRHMMAVWVAPEYRRSGAGAALLRAVLVWAAADGASTVSLWAKRHDHAASALYRRSGFEPTGVTTRGMRDPSVVEERWMAPAGAPG